MTAMPEPTPNHDRARPDVDQAGSRMSIATDAPTVCPAEDNRPRCRRCGHVVFTAASVQLGIGLACRRALARAANQEVAA